MEDESIVLKVLAGLQDGLPRETAAAMAGIGRNTFYLWLKQAEAGNEAAILFREAVEKAEAFAENTHLQNIKRAGEHVQQWTASAWWLERKMPEKWGRRDAESNQPRVQVFIGGQADHVQVQVANVSPSALSPVPRNELDPISTGQLVQLSPIIGNSVNQHEQEPPPVIPEPWRPNLGGRSPVSSGGALPGSGVKTGKRRSVAKKTRKKGNGEPE